MPTNPVAVITGATSGLGQLAAIELARHGFRLILTARSKERAEATATKIRQYTPGAQIDFYYGDLSLMKDVHRVGQEILSAHAVIDVLLNNAGIHAFELRVTAEGFGEMVAVNYFAPWLLTQILQPSLMKAGQARVVNVASEASRRHGILQLPGDLSDTSSFTARGSSALYGKTKLLNIMFTAELARRWTGSGITVNALNPGFNVTGLGRELRFAGAIERMLKILHIGDPCRGTDIIIRLILEPEYGKVTGGYFNVGTGRSIEPVFPGNDAVQQKKLWEATEDLLCKKNERMPV
ncbi:SDR family NAD(P)-dependent oxidoreductase [Paenibacillus sp. FSL R7-0345]|uniref:SDR family NAD(P)-dependent oxidoreductase n=1 Tax=Paenibacillus sp. FSL R7-0345 TaxID=2954535 RepID=UPI003159B1CA